MPRRSEILRKIRKAAKSKGLAWELVRQGGNHEIYSLDGLEVPISRGSGEMGSRYAETVYRELAPKLGDGWWRQ